MDIDLTGLVLPERIEAVYPEEGARSAQFIVEPLERGFGHTLGNSVRRVLPVSYTHLTLPTILLV